MATKQKIRVVVDGNEKIISVGAFAQIAAKRHFGVESIRDGDPEPVLFGVWVELEGAPKAGTDPIPAFDKWLQALDDFEPIEEVSDNDDDPTSESSDPSPGSQQI